jgi:spore germination protein PA
LGEHLHTLAINCIFERSGCSTVPSFVGNIKINSVSQGSSVNIGDVLFNVLSHTSKNNAGADSFTAGEDFGSVTNNLSSTNTNDPDVIDN